MSTAAPKIMHVNVGHQKALDASIDPSTGLGTITVTGKIRTAAGPAQVWASLSPAKGGHPIDAGVVETINDNQAWNFTFSGVPVGDDYHLVVSALTGVKINTQTGTATLTFKVRKPD